MVLQPFGFDSSAPVRQKGGLDSSGELNRHDGAAGPAQTPTLPYMTMIKESTEDDVIHTQT